MIIKTSADLMNALKNLDPILKDWIEDRYILNVDSPEEFEEMLEEDDHITCESDGAIEFVRKNGFSDPDSVKATTFIRKHFKDTVPLDFPYNIETEDGFELYQKRV